MSITYRLLLVTLLWISLFIFRSAQAIAEVRPESISLAAYLKQVEGSDPGYHSMLEASEAAQLSSAKAELIFRPHFFSQLLYVDNTLNTQAPSIDGTSTIKRNASFGLRGQTPWGLSVQISYDIRQSVLFNTDPNLVTAPNLTNKYINPQLNISLWQNFLGRSDRANEKMMKSQELANFYGKAYEARAALTQAEGRYWKLAIVREALKIETESARRAQAILDYDTRKQKQHLTDPGDLLVARAAVKGKELELKGVLDDERAASRALNSARGIDSDRVVEELELPSLEKIRALPLLERHGTRGDVQAAEQAALAQTSGSEMAREKLLPDVNLFSSVFAVGLNLSIPLDQVTTSSVRNGFNEQADAADLQYQRKRMDEQEEWNDLVNKFKESKERLDIAIDLESIQKAKFENVKLRRAKGLTIEDQVFQYELDYLNASLARVQVEGQILGLFAQMKLYGGEKP